MKMNGALSDFKKRFLRGALVSVFVLSIIELFVLAFSVFILNTIACSYIPLILRIMLGLLPLVLALFTTSKVMCEIIDLSMISSGLSTTYFSPDFFEKTRKESLRKSYQATRLYGDTLSFLYCCFSPEKQSWSYMSMDWR